MTDTMSEDGLRVAFGCFHFLTTVSHRKIARVVLLRAEEEINLALFGLFQSENISKVRATGAIQLAANTLHFLTRIRFVSVLSKIHFTLDDKLHFCGICIVMVHRVAEPINPSQGPVNQIGVKRKPQPSLLHPKNTTGN